MNMSATFNHSPINGSGWCEAIMNNATMRIIAQ